MLALLALLFLVPLVGCAPKPDALRVPDVLRLAEAHGVGAEGAPDCPDDGTSCLVTTRISPDVLAQRLGLPLTQAKDGWVASTEHLRIEMGDDGLFWTLTLVPLR
jgi:hypothetical protein